RTGARYCMQKTPLWLGEGVDVNAAREAPPGGRTSLATCAARPGSVAALRAVVQAGEPITRADLAARRRAARLAHRHAHRDLPAHLHRHAVRLLGADGFR